MNYQTGEHNGKTWLECLADGGVLASEQDALDLVGACGWAGTRLLLIPEGCLSPDFYNLRSGLAGQVLLKFSNYAIIAAAVVAPEISTQGRFGEFVWETNRGSQFRVYATREEALAWLETMG